MKPKLILALVLFTICSVTLAAKFEKKFVVAEKQLANNHIYTSDDADEHCNRCIEMVGDATKYENFPEKIRKRLAVDTVRYVCYFIDPSDQRDSCDKYVADEDHLIKALFVDKLPPRTICNEMKLCETKLTANHFGQIDILSKFTESHAMKKNIGDDANVKMPPFGSDECTWGPSFWCSSEKVMEKCKTLAYCKMRMKLIH